MITADEKRQCIERELRYRRRIYARLVERGKMSQRESERELELMEAIAEDYRKMAQAEALI